MSCTHDCGCTPEIRDARTDEWVQIAPESARAATLTPERPVKAPGQGGDLLLTRGTPVEVEWPNGAHSLYYVDEGGCPSQYAGRGRAMSKWATAGRTRGARGASSACSRRTSPHRSPSCRAGSSPRMCLWSADRWRLGRGRHSGADGGRR
jgi:hypothetical protein